MTVAASPGALDLVRSTAVRSSPVLIVDGMQAAMKKINEMAAMKVNNDGSVLFCDFFGAVCVFMIIDPVSNRSEWYTDLVFATAKRFSPSCLFLERYVLSKDFTHRSIL